MCDTDGSDGLSLYWMLPNETLVSVGTKYKNVVVSENGSILINNAQLDDSGHYRCVVTAGKYDQHVSVRRYHVVVIKKKNERKSSLTKTKSRSYIGKRYMLNCNLSFVGSPEPQIFWVTPKREILQPGSVVRESNIKVLENGTLEINSVASEHRGPYRCYGVNSFSYNHMTWWISVLDSSTRQVEKVRVPTIPPKINLQIETLTKKVVKWFPSTTTTSTSTLPTTTTTELTTSTAPTTTTTTTSTSSTTTTTSTTSTTTSTTTTTTSTQPTTTPTTIPTTTTKLSTTPITTTITSTTTKPTTTTAVTTTETPRTLTDDTIHVPIQLVDRQRAFVNYTRSLQKTFNAQTVFLPSFLPPTILAKPYSVSSQNTVVLNCPVLSPYAITVFWLGPQNQILSKIISDQNRPYFLSTLSLEYPSAGMYTCLAASIHGHSSLKVKVYENEKIPKILASRENEITALSGQKRLLQCQTEDETAKQWTLPYGMTIKYPWENEDYFITLNGDLLIKSVHPRNVGDYICTTMNKFGSDKMRISLSILEIKPVVISPINASKQVVKNGNLTLDCRATGLGQPSISWILPAG